MKNEKDYYLTTAITYTSGKPHIGNTYEIIFHKYFQYEVFLKYM